MVVAEAIQQVEQTEQFISAEAFYELANSPEYADKMVELIEGVIVEMSQPGGKHGHVTMKFSLRIGNFVEVNDLGWVTAAETGFITGKKPNGRDTVRGLDIAFIAKNRAPHGLPEGNIPFAPDLAVEVVSPHNSASDIHNKVQELLRIGTRLVWVVYYDSHTVVVHTPNGAKTLTVDDTLDGGEVLPGFTLNIQEIFGS
jgi:Uma2 family endonuclease